MLVKLLETLWCNICCSVVKAVCNWLPGIPHNSNRLVRVAMRDHGQQELSYCIFSMNVDVVCCAHSSCFEKHVLWIVLFSPLHVLVCQCAIRCCEHHLMDNVLLRDACGSGKLLKVFGIRCAREGFLQLAELDKLKIYSARHCGKGC